MMCLSVCLSVCMYVCILGYRLVREADGGNTIQSSSSLLKLPLIYILFEVMLMSGINEIRGCLEDYILLFLFDVCMV